MIWELPIAALFWVSVALLFYIYLGYPALAYVLKLAVSKLTQTGDAQPPVTFLITAHNEAKGIREKLENTLALNYPHDLFEIIVASDHSTDGTDEIVRQFEDEGIRLIRQAERLGKTSAQNMAVSEASGEIIVFSDATTLYDKDAVLKLVRNFADPSVGCAAGRLIYQDPTASFVGEGAKNYWSYETFLKECESQAGSLIGVSGCIYAVRKSAYMPMYPEACSDFLIATIMQRQGLRTVLEQEAVAYEETNRNADKEMKMRVRVISQTLNDLWMNRDMLNPFVHGFFAIALISHKLLRYLVPFILLLMLITSGLLSVKGDLFRIIFAIQILFYLSSGIGWFLQRSGKHIGPLSIPLYFSLTNIAAIIGFAKFLRGEKYSVWEPIRDNPSS